MTSAPDLLAAIVAGARTAAAAREDVTPLDVLTSQIRRKPAGAAFAAALSDSPPPRVIAECKRRSPSRGILREAYDPPAHAVAYAHAGAAAISVLTEPSFFDGAPEHLADVRASVQLPLLRKDFIVTRYQVVESAVLGADAVLLIVGSLNDGELRERLTEAGDLGLAALVEVHDEAELRRAIDAGARIIGVNSRNLRTLDVDPHVLERLIETVPDDAIAVAESGIREAADLTRLGGLGYDAFLIGERLITAPDPGRALAELRGQPAEAGRR